MINFSQPIYYPQTEILYLIANQVEWMCCLQKTQPFLWLRFTNPQRTEASGFIKEEKSSTFSLVFRGLILLVGSIVVIATKALFRFFLLHGVKITVPTSSPPSTFKAAVAALLTCPISGEPMTEPVTNLACGHTFDKKSVNGVIYCPCCNTPLDPKLPINYQVNPLIPK